jgi:hypothetical protein
MYFHRNINQIRMAKFWKAMNEPCITGAEFPYNDFQMRFQKGFGPIVTFLPGWLPSFARVKFV